MGGSDSVALDGTQVPTCDSVLHPPHSQLRVSPLLEAPTPLPYAHIGMLFGYLCLFPDSNYYSKLKSRHK